jgi:hypothetical protein
MSKRKVPLSSHSPYEFLSALICPECEIRYNSSGIASSNALFLSAYQFLPGHITRSGKIGQIESPFRLLVRQSSQFTCP